MRSNIPCIEQADKNANTNFAFDVYDTYQWYLKLGPLSNINSKFLHERSRYWNSIVEHPDYDVLAGRSVDPPAPRVHGTESECRRLLGPGRSVGAVADFPSCGRA